jgi:hypothetical protein
MPMSATKTADMRRLMLTCTASPLVSESQPITGWMNDEVTLYAVMRSPAARYEYPLLRMSNGRMAGSTGM